MNEGSVNQRWATSTLLALLATAGGVAIAIVAGPIGALVWLYLAYFAGLKLSYKQLPAVVKTLQGVQLSRQAYLTSMVFVGLWGPLFPTGLVLLCLSQELTVTLLLYAAWVACVLLAIVMAVHWKTVSVNTRVDGFDPL